jgi:hypothetical protein
MTNTTLAVVGGGPAGFFAAIKAAQLYPEKRVIILEKTRQLLTKVKISGGGRCNVTHACFDPAELVKFYPRGGNELRGPFTRYQPNDTIQWFESRGVQLKIEEDGRMFPITDQSDTIIHCLQKAAQEAGVQIWTECGVNEVEKIEGGFRLGLSNGNTLNCRKILFATGSNAKAYSMLEKLGHTIEPLVPSLFTFNIPLSPLLDLAGISCKKALVRLPEIGKEQIGPVLLTHWGLSGPAVLKLSAWGARDLHACAYQTQVVINWLPELTEEQVREIIIHAKKSMGLKLIGSEPIFLLPKQLWRKMISLAGLDLDQRWKDLSNKQIQMLITQLRAMCLQMNGKTTYKQEFVTCGGINLKEVNFKTLESRKCPGIYFAGEILNIDGITGGFNFQNAWTTGWIAGHAMGID